MQRELYNNKLNELISKFDMLVSLYYAAIYQSYFPTIKLQQSKNIILKIFHIFF